METEEFLNLSALYGLLSRLWIREVDLPLLESMNDPIFRSAIGKLGGSIPEEISSATVEELAIDYCQLFVGPKDHLTPVQSVWADGKLQGVASSSMRRYIELLPDFKSASTIPDHLGVQLQFLSELFAKAVSADHQETHETIAKQFFAHHLTWPETFLLAAEKKAETEFYQGLARMTRTFLEGEQSA